MWKCQILKLLVLWRTWTKTNDFIFLEPWYSLLEFNSRIVCQQLTNWTRWNKRDTVWSSANPLFKWRFRNRRRRCCLRSLVMGLGRWPGYVNFTWLIFRGLNPNGSIIPGKSAHFDRLFKTSSSPRVTASKQTMQNIVIATVEFRLNNTEKNFADPFGNQLPINLKCLSGLKITLVKFTYPKG